MNFINLQMFWWIPVILIFTGLLFWAARVRRTNIMRLILGPRAKDDKHVQLSLARRLFRFLLLLFVMLMLIVAIARPTWKLQLVPYQSSGRDLMVLFDVSKSMLAQDIRPSRLAHAKLFLRDLVNQTGSDRFGLVAFAGRAFLECPMTTDKTSFIQYVDELDTQSIPLGGTNLQLALETAMKAFDAAEGNNRAIVLITDGDELSGNSKLALGELKKAKIPLLIVGVGSSATPALIPVPQAEGQSVKFMRDGKGELVKTRLNVTLMQQLADTTGGYFVHSTTTNFGLGKIEAGIKKLLPAELEKGEKTRPVERFYYFLAFATIMLWLWMLISEHPGKKRGQLAKAAAIFVISILFAAQNTANAEALPKLPAPETKKPAPPITDPVKAYNQAREIQLKKKGDSSKLYETAINLAGKNPGVRTSSFNNLGVKQHQKARQTVMQAVGQVKQQNLDGAIGQLESAKKILDLAEEMYVKALSTKKPETLDEDKQAFQESARSQTAVNQQLLLNDRVMIDKLIKKIKELKKQQKKAQKQTQKAQKQQQKKNKEQKQDKKQDNKQDNKQQQQQKPNDEL
ncbi:MAG: VWA domain-containing protein, partial [Victivallaceae bacterium]|nr:VWA domain-containing protein [Victivallaceae bacterium]